MKNLALQFRDKFEHKTNFDCSELSRKKLYQGINGSELRDFIYILLDNKRLEGIDQSMTERYANARWKDT